MSSKRRRTADDVATTSKRAVSSNYYHPLQELNDDEKTDDDMSASTKTAVHIPPITILKSNTDNIHKLCKDCKIIKYSIRKISIGHKSFFESQIDCKIFEK